MDISIITGILSGSLGTIVITKTVDYFSAKTAFKRELKRQFFTKKLEAADSAVKFYMSAIDTYSQLQYSFNLLINDGNETVAMTLLNNTLLKVNQLRDSEYSQLNAIGLYFNLDNPKKNVDESHNKIANLISELIDKDQFVGILRQKRAVNEISQIDFDNTFNQQRKEAQIILSQLIEFIQKEKDRFGYLSMQICLEIKKHNV